jgi:hypothetical protein
MKRGPVKRKSESTAVHEISVAHSIRHDPRLATADARDAAGRRTSLGMWDCRGIKRPSLTAVVVLMMPVTHTAGRFAINISAAGAKEPLTELAIIVGAPVALQQALVVLTQCFPGACPGNCGFDFDAVIATHVSRNGRYRRQHHRYKCGSRNSIHMMASYPLAMHSRQKADGIELD